MLENVKWLGNAGIQISGSKTVYVDPWQIGDETPADLILITHDHDDHLSIKDIAKIQIAETNIVIPKQYASMVYGHVIPIESGKRVKVQNVEIEAVPAYNPSKVFHPKSKGNVGYVFRMDDVTYYHAGDTDMIPEMKSIQTDVAFLPIGGKYTMNAEEAADAVRWIKPKIVVPIHWGSVAGSFEDAEQFHGLCDCEVRILPNTSG